MRERKTYTEADRKLPLRQLQSQDKTVRAVGIAHLCKMFDPLVKTLAGSYQQHVIGAEREELEQVARVGLLEACATYKPKEKDRGGLFPQHATWCIRNALSKHVETLGNPVPLAAWLTRRLPKLRRAVSRLAQEFLREPTREELATEMKMPEHAIATMLAYDEGPAPLDDERAGKSFTDTATKVHQWKQWVE